MTLGRAVVATIHLRVMAPSHFDRVSTVCEFPQVNPVTGVWKVRATCCMHLEVSIRLGIPIHIVTSHGSLPSTLVSVSVLSECEVGRRFRFCECILLQIPFRLHLNTLMNCGSAEPTVGHRRTNSALLDLSPSFVEPFQ